MSSLSTLKSPLSRAAIALTLAVLLLSSNVLPPAQAAAGDLDPTFGNGGKVITDFFNSEDECSAMVIQPDGKIVVAGTVVLSSFENEFALARYNPDGSLDPTFGNGGKVTTAFLNRFSERSGRVHALALQPDGKILAVGEARVGEFISIHIALARYNTDGSLDQNFGDGGKVTTHFSDLSFNEEDIAFAVAIQPDGKIVTAGRRSSDFKINFSDFQLVRYNSNGSLDSTFGTGGQVTTQFLANPFGNICEARGVVIQPDGKIIAAGRFANTLDDPEPAFSDFALARYNTDGSLDPTFGSGGQVVTDFFGGADLATAIVLQPNGRIVASGIASGSNNFFGFGMARYNTNGNLDASFGNGGKVLTFPAGDNIGSVASALQPDGKIILAGPFVPFPFVRSIGFVIARYNSNGSQDASFGDGGKVITSFPGIGSQATAVAIQSDGRIVAAGTTFNNDFLGDFALARYDGASFNICLQDDSNGNLFQFNSTTGDYKFSNCRKGFTLTGRGTISILFCKIELEDVERDRNISVLANTCTRTGTASVRDFSRNQTFTISDRDITNNTCSCR
jgi:uncharacterized delta-60 repeat protein